LKKGWGDNVQFKRRRRGTLVYKKKNESETIANTSGNLAFPTENPRDDGTQLNMRYLFWLGGGIAKQEFTMNQRNAVKGEKKATATSNKNEKMSS